MIIFGLRSLKLKSYSFEEIGIANENSPKSRVEYRQKYFHLFFIPFFPVKKFFALRKEDGKLYDLNYSLTYKIEDAIKDKPKTPWYSFLVFILIFIMYFSIFCNLQYKSFKDKQSDIKNYEKKALQNKKELNNLNTNYLIKLTPSNSPYYMYKTDRFPLKVEKINGDSILLKKLFPNKLKYSSNKNLLEYYFINKNLVDSIWIKKETLKSTIYLDYDKVYESEKEVGLDFFNENKKYIISDIESIEGRIVLQFIENKFNKEEISITLINYGEPCEIIKIENVFDNYMFPNNIKWSNQLPQYLKSNNAIGEKFYLKGPNPNNGKYSYNIIIHLKTIDNKIYKFQIKKEIPKEESRPEIKIIK
ncbi:hypothetical protein [Cellulophaga sp. L1A9]|uniref:hypothetical protein n=1 Tax=Cellulophaga sp. L1A9 TaxID=2686362 RepID=UPI00131D3F27|nr:hypothetical protein [Cellulophaga sp. L1A9]